MEEGIMDKLPPLDAHHRWMAIVVWLATLAALIATSALAASTVAAGGVMSAFFRALASSPGLSGRGSADTAVSIVGIALALAAIVWILLAWFRFAKMTRQMIIVLAWLEQQAEEDTLFTDLLVFKSLPPEQPNQEGGTDLDAADSTVVSDAVRYLAFAWAALLALMPVASIVNVLFSPAPVF